MSEPRNRVSDDYEGGNAHNPGPDPKPQKETDERSVLNDDGYLKTEDESEGGYQDPYFADDNKD